MYRRLALFLVLLPAPLLAQSNPFAYVGRSDRLLYGPDGTGDRVLNFSRVGYNQGNTPLPDYATLGLPTFNVSPSPTGGDSLSLIQSAINTAAAQPLRANGFRAVVQLSPGLFKISDSVRINTSGIILRGAGDGTNLASNTTLAYTGTSQIDMIHVDNSSSASRTTSGSVRNVSAKTVPAGSWAVPLDSTSGFAVGNTVLIKRPSTSNWIHDIGMDLLDNPWTAGSKDQYYERTITFIDPKTKSIMLDTPLPTSFESKYGGGTVQKVSWARTNNVGIENLRGDGQLVPTTATDENHANSFVVIQDTQNAWVRNVTAVHQVYAGVEAGTGSKYVTVTDASYASPVSQITGGRRYSFNEEGQYALMENLASDESRHDFVNNSPSRGPNVFLNATATHSHANAGPHQRWSTGTLYDNVYDNNSLDVEDRGNSGTGHGWAGANMLVWNSTAGHFMMQSPPTSQNWIVGSTGTYDNTGSRTPAYSASRNAPVTLTLDGTPYTSLYQAQLADRVAHPNEQTRQYVVGDYDAYETGDAADAPAVDLGWLAAVRSASTNPIVGLDYAGPANVSVPFTFDFTLNPGDTVTSAVLTIAVKNLSPEATTDSLYIDSLKNGLAFTDAPALATYDGSTLLQLEFLPDDPHLNLSLLQDGLLNLLLRDDHALDWADLTITVLPAGSAVPEPVTLAVVVPALLAAAAVTRPRRR
jgi:hypothetical protein